VDIVDSLLLLLVVYSLEICVPLAWFQLLSGRGESCSRFCFFFSILDRLDYGCAQLDCPFERVYTSSAKWKGH
jgi:hypothetical protein